MEKKLFYQKSIFKILILLFTIVSIKPSNAIIEDVIEVIKFGKDITEGILQTWNVVEQTQVTDNIDLPFIAKKHKKVLNRITELSRQIDVIEAKTVNVAAWTMESINQFIKINTKLELGLHELSDLMNRISVHHELMKSYTEHFHELENNTLIDFAEFTVSASSASIQNILSRIHLIVHGTTDLNTLSHIGFLQLVGTSLKEAQQQVCETRQSAQQVLYQLYKSISITELKGYAMMQFSCMLLKIYGKGNFTRESQIMREMFEKRTQKTQDLLQNVMQRAERSVWRCDPRVHVQGETYEEVTRLLQGYIENEVDMNNDGTCKENCGHYEYTEHFGCYAEMYCNRQPKCKGKLLNCKFIDSDMWICPARQTNSNKRRYEYIEYENGRILGKQKNCVTGTTKVESWWRWLFWHCSYCLCVCDEQGPLSDRYFNLREVTTNVTENKVVTGLRFRKINRIIHLQVQEGTLMERGLINDTTLKWKEMSEYRLLDRGIKNGLDYHTLGWDRRSIDLDDLIAPQKHVCTGVRFRVVGTHLNLEMRVTEIDFTNGKLIEPEKSYWISNDNTDISKIKRTPVKLINPDIPTYAHSSSLPDSKTNQYVEFTHTDVDSDVAQTTVPYLDAQDCVSIPPVALAGVGIYHKGLPMSGGFVAPKLITYDFSSYIDTPKPPTQNTDENFIETF